MPGRLLHLSSVRRTLRLATAFFLLSRLGLFLAAVSWDFLTGDLSSGFGRKQVLGVRVAGLLLLTGAALSDRGLLFWQKLLQRPPFKLSSLRWGLVVLFTDDLTQ
jgi:hypothetical protein